MSYTAQITRNNPSCILILVDHSNSMQEVYGGDVTSTKAEEVANAINNVLRNLVLKSAKNSGLGDYFYVGVLGYGDQVASAFGGALAGQPWVPISQVANNPLRIEEQTIRQQTPGGQWVDRTMKRPIWVEPVCNGWTPMDAVLNQARTYLDVFLGRYPDCFPPIVINITDGMPSDKDPRDSASALRSLASSDGNVLLFNIHITSDDADSIAFPDSEAGMTDKLAKLLFRMSSPLPASMHAEARKAGFNVNDQSRCFVYNADASVLVKFLNVGTASA